MLSYYSIQTLKSRSRTYHTAHTPTRNGNTAIKYITTPTRNGKTAIKYIRSSGAISGMRKCTLSVDACMIQYRGQLPLATHVCGGRAKDSQRDAKSRYTRLGHNGQGNTVPTNKCLTRVPEEQGRGGSCGIEPQRSRTQRGPLVLMKHL